MPLSSSWALAYLCFILIVMVRKRNKKLSDCDLGHHKRFLSMGGFSICQVCGDKKSMGQVKDVEVEAEDGPIDPSEWDMAFSATLLECSKTGVPFTSRHIVAMIGGEETPDVEDMLVSASKRHIIRLTGEVRDGYEEWIGV